MIKKTLAFLLFFSVNAHAGDGGIRDAMEISASGMKSQARRLSIISQNIANAESAGASPNDTPYTRQNIILAHQRDRKKGINLVKVRKIVRDKTPYDIRFDPDHPAANDQGYVRYPNVNKTVEAMDAREAQRSYEANLTNYEVTKSMEIRTIDLIKN